MVVKNLAKLSSCAVLCFLLGITPVGAADIESWDNLKEEAENAADGSTVTVTKDITATGSSIGLLQKVLTLDFDGHTVTGGKYGDEPPLLFAANGSSETKVAVRNAVFKNFTVGEEGVIYSSNPHLEVIDVSLLNNKGSGEGVAIKNSAYNKFQMSKYQTTTRQDKKAERAMEFFQAVQLRSTPMKAKTLQSLTI